MRGTPTEARSSAVQDAKLEDGGDIRRHAATEAGRRPGSEGTTGNSSPRTHVGDRCNH